MVNKSYSKFIVFVITALLLASCVSQKSTVVHKQKTEQDDIIEYGKKYLHKPYRYAAKGPNSFDCSGFTSFVFKEFGYKLNPSSAGQSQQGKTVRRKDDLQVGDLVFFEGRSHNGRVGHVGIVSEVRRNGKFMFLHASTQHGVIFSSSEEPYYKARYLRGSRILKDQPKEKRNTNQANTPDARLVQATASSSNQSNSANENSSSAFQQSTAKLTNGESTTVAIHSRPANGNVQDATITSDPTNKPVKSKNPEDKEKKESDLKSQTATILSEESLLPPPVKTTHVVKPGETLFSISKKHKCTVDELQAWNPTIENGAIKAGDTLRINK